jgi:large subunit ribosomal protein L3
MKTLQATKIGMTHLFLANGNMVAATALKVDDNVITQVKTPENDGYSAVQVGFGKRRQLNKPQAGHFKGLGKFRKNAEVRVDAVADYEVGQRFGCDIFGEGDYVDVSGRSVGKGFAGTIKRHNYSRGPMTHGHDHHRRPGSIGNRTQPGRVIKGKTMAGRMGNRQVTTQNLQVVKVDTDNRLVYVDGSVPGKKGQLIVIKAAVKKEAPRA